MENMYTRSAAEQSYFDAVQAAAHATGAARDAAYLKAVQLAGPAIIDRARTVAGATTAHFIMNYTDEGCSLVMKSIVDKAGRDLQVDERVEDVIDEIVFLITGAGETGAGIPGMRKMCTDQYELTIVTPQA